MGFPRSVQWDESGTTLAIGTTGNAVCLVQPGDLTTNGKPNGRSLYCMQSYSDTNVEALTASDLYCVHGVP
jgi:hypothetical protein